MNNSCELQAIVVSHDTAVLGVISNCLTELGIAGICHPDRESAIGCLQKQKIDAFFVDQELDHEFLVLDQMRSSSSGRGAVGFAIVPQTSDVHTCRAADFVITKPVTKLEVARTLRAAYAMMLKERRRYSRHNLRCEAILSDATGRKCMARTTNISQTGIALECELPLPAGAVVQLQVALPRVSNPCRFEGRVIWSAANGKAGLTFTHMSSRDQECLTEWIDAEFLRQWHPMIPQSIAPSFVRAAH